MLPTSIPAFPTPLPGNESILVSNPLHSGAKAGGMWDDVCLYPFLFQTGSLCALRALSIPRALGMGVEQWTLTTCHV